MENNFDEKITGMIINQMTKATNDGILHRKSSIIYKIKTHSQHV